MAVLGHSWAVWKKSCTSAIVSNPILHEYHGMFHMTKNLHMFVVVTDEPIHKISIPSRRIFSVLVVVTHVVGKLPVGILRSVVGSI